MVLLIRVLFRLFRGGEQCHPALKGKPISCLSCNKSFAVKPFPQTNGVCPRCGKDRFSFLTDYVPDEELEANENLSDGAKFVLDAEDKHIEEIRGRMLIQYLKNHDLVP